MILQQEYANQQVKEQDNKRGYVALYTKAA